MRLSIIIPALNEAATLPATLAPLQALRARGHQVLLVDGGSADATAATAKPLVDRVLTGRRGRATQMNAGAAAADGDILLFLHADTRLDAEIAHALLAALPSSGRRWGRFDVAIAGRSPALPLIATEHAPRAEARLAACLRRSISFLIWISAIALRAASGSSASIKSMSS